MTASYDKQGQPVNAEAWGKAKGDALMKASKLATTSKDTKAIAAANAEVTRLQEGYQKASDAEAKAVKGKPAAEKAQARYGQSAPAQAPSTILGKLFGQ